jgi:hypothetical protein
MGMDSFCAELGNDCQHPMAYQVCNFQPLVLVLKHRLTLFRTLGDIGRQGLGRYATVFRALVEAAIVSWIATFGSAVAWTLSLPGCLEKDCMLVSIFLAISCSCLTSASS